jgi:hypothetical protein
MVEQWTHKPLVDGSNPSLAIIPLLGVKCRSFLFEPLRAIWLLRCRPKN